MIEVTPEIHIDENDIQEIFIRSSGPGGQNVNKVSTAVQLRYDLTTANLPEDVHQRLRRLAGKRINSEGVLIIEAKENRSQEQNRHAALDRLVAILKAAAEKPKNRKKTQPSAASKQRRLEKKRRRSEIKRYRGSPSPDEF
jgi:ribosome-associated protein